MKKTLFRLFIYLVMAGAIFGPKNAMSQTAGTMSFTVNQAAHTGQYGPNGAFHFVVIWLQNANGNFVKTLYRSNTGTGKDVWEHCQVWFASNGTLPYGNVVDAATAATLSTYPSPVTATWAGSDTTNPAPFKLVPDGDYRIFVEYAWDATYVMGAGRDTMSVAWTKGPSPVSLTPPNVTNFNGMSLTWTPSVNTNTITTSAVAPTTYVAGTAVSVPFTIGGTSTIYANNVWTAQLSDASGSFASPLAIGTLTGISAGTVSATIPAGTINGTGYKIRVVGSAPGTTGTDNGANITITNGTSPTLIAAAGATVDNSFNVTFADDAAWRTAITSVTINGTPVTAGYSVLSGAITFIPSTVTANLLQVNGTKIIKVIATGYNDAIVSQAVGVGVDNKLAVKTQATSPLSSGGLLVTQPVISIQDQYGNLTASTASITANVGTGAWTIGGTSVIPAIAGTATFTNLTATSAAFTAATISFTSGTLTAVSSNSFNVSVPVSGGTVTVGTAGNFTSFTKADGLFNALNTGGLTGNLTVNVISDIIDEDGAVALNQLYEISGSGFTINIQPSGGAARTVSGSVVGALLNFNGADRVTIDGLNTAGNALTISNLSTSSVAGTSTIKFANDATNNTITNATVLGSSTTLIPAVPFTTDGGTILIGSGVVTGNDNITISNSKVGPAGANLPSKGIYSSGSVTSSAIANSNIIVTGCEIYDFSQATKCAGILVFEGNTNWTISNNKLYQTGTRTYAASGTMYGMYIVSQNVGDNFQITGNTIGFASATGTGTLTLVGTVAGAGAFNGINFATSATAATTCNVSNNVISDISLSGTTEAFIGISSGTLMGTNTINISNNTVKNISHTGTTGAVTGIAGGSAATLNVTTNTIDGITKNLGNTTGAITGISYKISGTIACNNNIIKNITASSPAATGAIYGINSNVQATTISVVGNNIFNINSLSTAAQNIMAFYDQYNVSNTAKTIQNNTINTITLATGAGTIYGIRTVAVTTADISGNTINTLTGGANIYGIATAAGINNVFKNKLYDFSATAANPIVYGIYANGGTINNIHNNFVGDLKTPAANAATPLMGIHIGGAATSANVYYNTVNLNATSTGALFGSSAIFASTTPTLDLRNNIFSNTSTPKGAGITSAYRRNNPTLTNYASTSNNNLFYAGTPSATNLILFDSTNTYQTLAAYQTAMATRDAASISAIPNFVSTLGSDATYLHINPAIASNIESGAALIATYTTDFDGDVRNVSTPDIGADEFAGLKACNGTPTVATINTIPSLCTGTGTTLSLSTSYTDEGMNYQWGYSLTPGGPYTNLGIAATQATGTLTATTYYICKITCANSGLFVTTAEATATIISPVTPDLTITNLCGSTQISTTATGTLTWSNSASTTSPISVTSGGAFTVTQTTVEGCISLAANGTAAPLTIPSAPAVTVTNLCGSSQISTTATGTLYWSNSASTTSPITVTSGGAFTVTQTVGGCTSTTGSGTAAPFITVPVTISASSNVLTSTATTGNQWYSVATGLLVGEVGQSYTAIGNGSYYSIATDGNGCPVTSNTIVLSSVSVNANALANSVNVYPNPTSKMINIAFNQLNGNCNLTVTNTLGANIYEENLEQINGLVKSIDLSNYSNGVYFVNIQSQNSNLRYKVILNK